MRSEHVASRATSLTGVRQSAVREAARRLRVDSRLVDVVTLLRAEGIEPLLLKGPVIARWLYAAEPSARPYTDIDLLVSPTDRDRAAATLIAQGYEMQGEPMPSGDEPHARAFERDSDAVAVDLHRVLHGMEHLSAERVWQAVSADVESLHVAGIDVAIPNEVVRTLHLVLHLSPRDGPGSKAWHDLSRGLEIIDRKTWKRAADLARTLGIGDEMGHRLSLVPAAATHLAALQLPSSETGLYAAMRITEAGSQARGVISLLQLAAQPSMRGRAAYIQAKLFPTADVLRDRYAVARRGGAGLVVAQMLRSAACLVALPLAVVDYRRARSSKRRRGT